ncbi:MAG: hypothetical protein QOE97_2053 [Pseudonocardiales bacterium]|jgi:hypothetical protein|nr:hypothetical protein [Pseudonocardiales bacterium]
MESLRESYDNAMKEFEALTNKRAAVLKNKGKEAGVAKLKVLFKSGKTLAERLDAYDKANVGTERAKTKDEVLKSLKNMEVAYAKLSEGIKKNVAAFELEARDIGPSDPDMKTGFGVLINRLKMINNRGKMELEIRRNILKERAGKTVGVDEKLNSAIKTVYLNIRKGCEETEALMKKFKARPTRQNLDAAFSSGTGPRSISVAVTSWKQVVLKQDPTAGARLDRAGGGDPVHLLQKIFDLTQRKDATFWDQQLRTDQPGWEQRAIKVADEALAQVANWRRVADSMKQLTA